MLIKITKCIIQLTLSTGQKMSYAQTSKNVWVIVNHASINMYKAAVTQLRNKFFVVKKSIWFISSGCV